MKYILLIIPLMMLSILLGSSVPLTNNVAYAQGYWQPKSEYQYNLTFRYRGSDRHIRTEAELHGFLQELLAYLQELLGDMDGITSEVEVTTGLATDITDDSAQLHGEVIDFNDSDYATVWFQYGRSSSALTEITSSERIDDSEDGDFERRISDLREGTRYYFRAIARDDNGRNDYGSIRQFTTDENDNADEEPDVTTRSATNVTDDSASLRGDVDMNDFNNGIVFFVYGEDESQIEDTASDYDTYADIDEDGRDLQKIRVDSDLDGSASYEVNLASLEDDTHYYFSICVEYEDDVKDEIICGSVEDFRTEE